MVWYLYNDGSLQSQWNMILLTQISQTLILFVTVDLVLKLYA